MFTQICKLLQLHFYFYFLTNSDNEHLLEISDVGLKNKTIEISREKLRWLG